MDMDQRKIALGIARTRAINGLIMLIVPGIAGKAFLGKAADNAAVRALLRLVGIRDLVLGVGAITTLKEGTMDAEWVGVGAVCDAVDAAVMLLSPGLGSRARLSSLAGASAAFTGLMASRAIADARIEAELEEIVEASEIDS
jgi:hypothetical protein